ncbi:MAG: glycosyltransferase [Elusimicrobia bacterium]|nr:glycosyltransferase [Elusimicrobiota bacterium]
MPLRRLADFTRDARAEQERLTHDAAARWKFALVALNLFFSLRYLHWRAAHTLNDSSDFRLFVSLALLLAEVYGFASVVLFFVQVLSLHKARTPATAPAEPPTVDVFVTIYNEPVEILRRTLVACRALDYPADKLLIHVLDDGPRAEVAAVAAAHGCRYVTRADRLHAKAGNLNHGLSRTSAELLLLLDVDHVPVSSFLKETVGFFSDPKVAFVQTPHHFYNPDCYQRNLVLEQELVHEQDLFFQVIQPGRDAVNATVFAGSAALFRRAALEDVGGFRTDCAIEDMHTGMELQSRGWTSVYYRRVLSAGLSPEDFMGYLTQRKRWARGGVQLFFLDNPLVKRGLGLRQRLSYFGSLLYFFHAWARLVYLLAPLSFLLLRCDPIVAGTWTLVGYFLPHYLFSHLAFDSLSREYRSPFWSDVYEAASCFALAWTALVALFRPDALVFDVTPKGLKGLLQEQFHWRIVLPHVILMGLLVAGIVHATFHFMSTRSTTLDSYLLSCIWAVFNFILMACSIEVAREHPHKRKAVRLRRRFPVVLHADGREWIGRTIDLSETGALVTIPDRAELPHDAVVRILGEDQTAILECAVRHCRWVRDEGSRVGLRFHAVGEVQRAQLVRLLFSPPESWQEIRRPNVDSVRAMGHIASTVLRKRLRRRGGAASTSGAPAELLTADGPRRVRLEELHDDHAVVTLDARAELPGPLALRLPHRKLGELIVRVEAAGAVGAVGDSRTMRMRFLAPEKVKVGPVLSALEEAA